MESNIDTTKKIISMFVLVFILFSIFSFSYFIYVKNVSAVETEITLLEPLPFEISKGLTTKTTPSQYILGLVKLLIGVAVVLAVFMIVWGGFEYVLTEAVVSKSDAKKRITQAILGLLLALSSYLILNTINPDLVNFRLDFGSVEETNGTISSVNK